VSGDLTTPVGVEARLRHLVTDLSLAQRELAAKRDEEVKAKHAYHAARRRAIFAPESPKVARGGYTTADRDAWVDDKTANEHVMYDVAVAAREAAQDHLRVVRDQAMVVMAINSSMRTAYNVAGSGR
jgi:hypothetical protein